ncbi:hypothetical protein PV327_011405, partial [Microctonus hyperodae]
MPRKAKRSVDEIFEIIKELHFFDCEGRILPLSNPIWLEAEKKCEKQPSRKHLYLYLTQNRNGILSKFDEKENVQKNSNSDLIIEKRLRVRADEKNFRNKPYFVTKIALLQNGNQLRPQNICGHCVMVRNTCAFDSAVQSFLGGYSDYITYNNVRYECVICGWTQHDNIFIAEINMNPIYINGMRGLEDAINENRQKVIKKCKRCVNDEIVMTVMTGPHLIIDIEYLQWAHLAENSGHYNWS